MRCCSLKISKKNDRESTQLPCLHSQFPDWLIHFQELDCAFGTKFLHEGAGSFKVKYNYDSSILLQNLINVFRGTLFKDSTPWCTLIE